MSSAQLVTAVHIQCLIRARDKTKKLKKGSLQHFKYSNKHLNTYYVPTNYRCSGTLGQTSTCPYGSHIVVREGHRGKEIILRSKRKKKTITRHKDGVWWAGQPW